MGFSGNVAAQYLASFGAGLRPATNFRDIQSRDGAELIGGKTARETALKAQMASTALQEKGATERQKSVNETALELDRLRRKPTLFDRLAALRGLSSGLSGGGNAAARRGAGATALVTQANAIADPMSSLQGQVSGYQNLYSSYQGQNTGSNAMYASAAKGLGSIEAPVVNPTDPVAPVAATPVPLQSFQPQALPDLSDPVSEEDAKARLAYLQGLFGTTAPQTS
jgi:hypothetical protein